MSEDPLNSSNEPENPINKSDPRTTLGMVSRLVGVVVIGWLAVLILSPASMLPFGTSSMIVDPYNVGDEYKVFYQSDKPIIYEDFSTAIPPMEGWLRVNATEYLGGMHIKPKKAVYWHYSKGENEG